jgi:hypothetical protein
MGRPTVGGDVIDITYKHPTLGSGTWYVKSGETSTFDPGGFISNDDDMGIDGSGTMITEMTQQRWCVEATIRNDMNSAREMEQVSALAGDVDDADYIITHVNGSVYGGSGRPVGKVPADGKAATMKIKLAGGGALSQV